MSWELARFKWNKPTKRGPGASRLFFTSCLRRLYPLRRRAQFDFFLFPRKFPFPRNTDTRCCEYRRGVFFFARFKGLGLIGARSRPVNSSRSKSIWKSRCIVELYKKKKKKKKKSNAFVHRVAETEPTSGHASLDSRQPTIKIWSAKMVEAKWRWPLNT